MTLEEEMEIEERRQAAATSLELLKAERALFAERSLSLQRAVLEYAQIMVRSVILANGATATAILAFLGNLSKEAPHKAAHGLELAAGVAALGVGLGVLATLFAYLSQWNRLRTEFETGTSSGPAPQRTRTWALISVTSGLICFLIAIAIAIFSFDLRA